jgi:putative copper export protein
MHAFLAVALLGGLGLLALGPSWQGGARVVAEGVALALCLRGVPVVIVPLLAAALLAGTDAIAAVHVVSAGLWAGGILALASLRLGGGWSAPAARELVERFGGVALIAFAATALTGVVRATERLHDLDQLWSTPYGDVLLAKCAGVAAMLVLSLAWRRGMRASRAEAAVTVAVVGATSLLAVFPVPVN